MTRIATLKMSLDVKKIRKIRFADFQKMERAMRIELTTKAWEAFVLPLNYARKPLCYMIVARLFEKSIQKSY